MQKTKKIRIFAGPDGWGKSTLFEQLRQIYYTGYFINADEIEKQLATSRLIDISSLGLKISESDLNDFKMSPQALSLI